MERTRMRRHQTPNCVLASVLGFVAATPQSTNKCIMLRTASAVASLSSAGTFPVCISWCWAAERSHMWRPLRKFRECGLGRRGRATGFLRHAWPRRGHNLVRCGRWILSNLRNWQRNWQRCSCEPEDVPCRCRCHCCSPPWAKMGRRSKTKIRFRVD